MPNTALSHNRRTIALVVVPPLVAAIASIIGMLTTADLPEQLAAHWGVNGAVNRTDTVWSYVWIVAIVVPIITLAVAAYALPSARFGVSRTVLRLSIGFSIGFGVFISLAMYLTVVAQRGVEDATKLPA